MELYRPRSSSIPRHLRQLPVHERFTVTDAAQLKLKLQALDDKLDRDVDIELLKSACQPRPFHEEIYVAGSEEFYLLVKGIGRPDLIPEMYIDAFHTVQQGRFPINRYKVSDFRKGVDATFSEVRALLPKIDQVCGTKLDQSYRALENEVKKFPFLTLPAELRLQIYSHLLPREAHLAVLQQPNPERKPPRISLDILRTNRQLYAEVTKYFYQGRTLFMVAAREQISGPLSDEFLLRYYETIATMSPAARENFTKMEIQIGFLNDQTFIARRYPHVERVSDPFSQIFKLLPNITTVVISTRNLPPLARTASSRWFSQRPDTMVWLLGEIPEFVQVQYARVGPRGPEKDRLEDETLRGLLEARGPVIIGESLLIHGGLPQTKDIKVFYEYPGRT